MAYVKDLWTDVARDEKGQIRLNDKGKPVREKNERWGRGKRWLACWLDPNGKEKSAAFAKKTEAETYAGAMEADAARGVYIDPNAGKVLVGKLLDSLLQSKRVGKSSADRYETADRLHVRPKWGDRQARGINASDVRDWVTEMEAAGYGFSTVKQSLALLRGALDLAAEDQAIRINPARSTTIKLTPRKKEPIALWSREQAQMIIDGHSARYRMIPTLGISCGPRPNEVFALAVEDIDDDAGLLRIDRQLKRVKTKDGNWSTVFGLPKYSKTRTTTLPKQMSMLLREHMAAFPPVPITLKWEDPDGDDDRTYNLIFTSPGRGGNAHFIGLANYTTHIWSPALVHAGLLPPPQRNKRGTLVYGATGANKPHAWRHYFASDSLRRLVPITSVSADMGHASSKITFEVYSHVMPDAHDVSMQAGDARLADFTFSALTEQ